MRNPNGPSIEEKEAMQDQLDDMNAQYVIVQTADMVAAHETSYHQRSDGMWVWECSCGCSVGVYGLRDDCVVKTRLHWGEIIQNSKWGYEAGRRDGAMREKALERRNGHSMSQQKSKSRVLWVVEVKLRRRRKWQATIPAYFKRSEAQQEGKEWYDPKGDLEFRVRKYCGETR